MNCTIAKNKIPSGRYGAGIMFDNSIVDSMLIMNSVIYGNLRQNEAISEQIYNAGGRLVLRNNFITNTGSDPSATISTNNIFTTSDPFISSSNNNFALSNISNAIGAGLSSTTFYGATRTPPTTDYLGVSRPLPAGSNPDMGAIENALSIRAAITYTVKTDGSGDYTVIQTAIDASTTANGDTVLVYPGTYTENMN